MPIRNPIELVEEFKKSGEFDRLRRELLQQFRTGESISSFLSRVEDITKEKLASDGRLRLMGLDMKHAELLQEIDRYPIVERAVSEVPAFSDPSFSNNIRKSLSRILEDDRKGISVADGQSRAYVGGNTPLMNAGCAAKWSDSARRNRPPSERVNSPVLDSTTNSLINPNSNGDFIRP